MLCYSHLCVVQSDTTKVNLDKATREELVEFVKKQSLHTKKIEKRCVGMFSLSAHNNIQHSQYMDTELFDAYKALKREKEEWLKTQQQPGENGGNTGSAAVGAEELTRKVRK